MDITADLNPDGRLTIRGVNDDGTVRNADVELLDAAGKRWSATVLTTAEINRLMETWQSSGECQAGAFFRVPDLIVVRDPSKESVIQVFAELLRTGEHHSEMTLLSDE